MSKLVTIDFDDTLCLFESDLPVWVNPGEEKYSARLNPAIAAKIVEHRSAGDRVCVLTTRALSNMASVHQFIADHDLSFDEVWSTDYDWKGPWLIRNTCIARILLMMTAAGCAVPAKSINQ
jgi:hypothetical protein